MQHKSHFRSLALGLAILFAMSGSALSQETPRTESADTTALPPLTDILEEVVILEELVVIGTRAQPRSVTESAVPIDVVAGEDFVKQGGSDVQDLLRNVVPSYNVNLQPISDAATVVRPPNLRGLAPDHALVLVNGKRRHRASVIYWLGNGLSDAAQGPDISAIPSIALKRVEVLRDGASAQYGSDAIAGVLNFELKDDYKGGSVEIKPGIFRQGDGGTYALAGNIGLGTPDTWINLSVEYGNTDETDRSVQRNDAARLIRVGNTQVADPAQPWGQPFVRDDLKIFANYGATINENIEFYGHGNYASKEVEGGFYFRNPNTRGGVYQGPVLMWDGTDYYTPAEAAELGIVDGINGNLVATLLVGNMSGGDVPVVPISCSVPDAAALRQVFDDPNLFTFQELFPGGFTPRFGGNTEDRAFLAGIKGTRSLLTWDLSASYGRHHSDFFIFNTVNASLGPNSPTEFDPGDYIQTDTNFNFDVTYPFSEQFFFAAGLEYRTENFEVVKGQAESFEIGPLASQGFSSASNGFPGFGDIAAGSWSRSNWAIYGDAEFNPQENWLLAAALRFENFEDFGATTNFKLATNYGVNENVKVRGSFSTGFRAPTPGQQNAFNVTTEFGTDDEGNFILVNKGTIPSTHPAAELVGGKGLEPEKSINISAGFVWTRHIYPVDTGIAPVNLTVDYFNITVQDRMTTSQDFELNPTQVEQLLAAGITSARNLQQFRFFTNDFETKTQGIDLVFTAPFWCNGELSFAYNYTSTEVTQYDSNLLNTQRITLLENGLPRHRANLTLAQPVNKYFSALGRVSYYGSWHEWPFGDSPQVYARAYLVDLESSLSIGGGSTITVGVQNVLNTEPDNITEGSSLASVIGRPFGEYSPYGFGGTFLYGKYNFNF